eukprot:5550899-Pleurochrysis_carterae.AAC.1
MEEGGATRLPDFYVESCLAMRLYLMVIWGPSIVGMTKLRIGPVIRRLSSLLFLHFFNQLLPFYSF